MKIGLALSGGGARGVFHIGVLQAFDDLGLRPDIMAGCSAGALVGSLYSVGVSPSDMLDLAISTKWFRFLKPSLPDRGIADLTYIEFILRKYIPEDDFKALKIPLKVVATNLNTGMMQVFEKGKLVTPVLASCAVPMIFKPIEIDGAMYVDGGIIMNLPSSIVKYDCDYLIGVSLNPIYKLSNNEIQSIISLMNRCLDISINSHSREQKMLCNLLIESDQIIPFSKFKLSHANALYQLGYDTAIRALRQSQLVSSNMAASATH